MNEAIIFRTGKWSKILSQIMGSPKLLKNKPKKSAIAEAVRESNLTETVALPHNKSSTGTAPSSHKKSFSSRYRYALPALLAVNLVVGGYVLFRTSTSTGDKELRENASPVVTESMLQPVSTVRSPPGEK